MPPKRDYDPTKSYNPQMQPPVLRTMAPDILNYMRLKDARAFAYTAWWFDVYLLVRRSNEHSIRFIDQAGYTPKPADCKAKTAKKSFFHNGLGRPLDVAGLVCDPTLPEFEKAYGAEHANALEHWAQFSRHYLHQAYDADGARTRMWITGGRFFVDLRLDSPTYGVAHQTDSGLVTAGKAIHGDYDLFGIVPADNPAVNIALSEEHPASPVHRYNTPADQLPDGAKVPNCRGREFTDVQMMLNRRIGAPMVLHGSQEKYTTEIDDKEAVDVFFPDGERSLLLANPEQIRGFYAHDLKGRKMMDAKPGSPHHGDPWFGKWRRHG